MKVFEDIMGEWDSWNPIGKEVTANVNIKDNSQRRELNGISKSFSTTTR